MRAFVIRFHGKLMLAHHPVLHRPQRGDASGWRPYVWTKDIARAEKFDNEFAAQDFARIVLKPDHSFDVVELTPRPLSPTGVA